jgi:6-phosphogluconolactonase
MTYVRATGACGIVLAAMGALAGCGSSGSGSSSGSSSGSTSGAGSGALSGAATGSVTAGSTGSSGGSGGVSDAGPESAAPADGGDATVSDAGPSKEVLYANAGTTFNTFDLDPTTGDLTLASSMALPELLQFAEFDSTQTHLYAGIGAATDPTWSFHSFSIDPGTGALAEIPTQDGGVDAGADAATSTGVVSPNGRIINLTLSRDNKYLLAVHNVTEAYTVFQLNADGTIGPRVIQADGGDTGIGAFLHQIHVDPTNKYVTICDRGNDPTYGSDGGITAPEALGHLLVYAYASGELTQLTTSTITFPSGIGPRHLDWHPTQPWVYLSAERGNRLIMYTFASGVLTQQFDVPSVANPADSPDSSLDMTEAINGQRAGAIHVHPSGKFLWITNRNYALVPYVPDAGADAAEPADAGDAAPPAPIQVFDGVGENNLVLFSIDQTTGEPTLVSAADSHGFEPRTFTLDPSGQYVIVGNQKKISTVSGGVVTTVNPNLTVFQVATDGQLTFLKTYDQSGEVWWEGARAITGP